MLFPEKRRTRIIGFEKSTTRSRGLNGYDINDFDLTDYDRDGILNAHDPFPLDKSYPGGYITGMDLPLIVFGPDDNVLNYKSIFGDNSLNTGTFSVDFDTYLSTLANTFYTAHYTYKDVEEGNILALETWNPCYLNTKYNENTNSTELMPKWYNFNSGSEEFYYIYWEDANTPDNEYNFGKVKISVYDSEGSYYWFEKNSAGYLGCLLKVPVNETIRIEASPFNKYDDKSAFRLKVVPTALSRLCLDSTDFLETRFATGNSIDTDLGSDDYKINIVSLKNNNEGKYTALDMFYSDSDTNLSKKVLANTAGMAKEFSETDYGQDNPFQIAKDIFKHITGKEAQSVWDLADIFEFASNRETHLFFSPEVLKDSFANRGLDIASRWGLPGGSYNDNKKWDYLSYDTLFFSTMKNQGDFIGRSSWIGLDNTILYDPGRTDMELELSDHMPAGSIPVDRKYKIQFNSGHNLALEETIAIKLIIENYENDYSVRIFVSGNAPENFSNKYGSNRVKLLNLEDSGFTTDHNEIVYDPDRDNGRFWDYMYTLYNNNKRKTDTETYTLFFFLIPTDDFSQWSLVGSTAHFWPLKDRTTVVAKLDKENNVIGAPFVLPYEYLVYPSGFISTDKIKSLYQSLEEIPDYAFLSSNGTGYDNLFTFNANEDEKLLFMQGVIISGSDCPVVDTSNITFFPGTSNSKSNISNSRLINKEAIPDTTAANKLVRSFINNDNAGGRLFTNAYIMSFDEVPNSSDGPGELEIAQTNFLNANSILALTIEGIDPPHSAPANLTATADSSSRIALTWSDNNPKVSGYQIERKSENEGESEFTAIYKADGADIRSYSDSTVLSDTSYTYRIFAYNAAGNSPPSNEAQAATGQTIPAPPANFTGEALSDKKVQLTWRDNSHNETEFVILRMGPDNIDFVELHRFPGTRNTGGEERIYNDINLTAETGYSYEIYAANDAGNSTSQRVEVTTTPPLAVSILTCDLELRLDGSGLADHWIPNTNELSRPFRVKLEGFMEDMTPALLPGAMDIKLLAPADLNWTANDMAGQENFNLFKNKSNCSFGLFATDQEGTGEVRLASFSLPNPDGAIYTVNYAPDYFTAAGNTLINSGALLQLDNNGYITFTANGSEYSCFAVKALANTGTIRPGDDFGLRFTLADYDEVTPAQAAEGDFLAVYDKKMVWRANLYIDEGEAVDWNNMNLWNSAGNEWRVLQTEGADLDGGQITISPWTRYYQEETFFNYPQVAVSGSVAYTSGGSDSPFQFNRELTNQLNCLRVSSGNHWARTTAPDGNWNNYENLPVTSGTNTYYPYRPNYSAWKLFGTETWVNANGDIVPAYWENSNGFVRESSGVDCSGFLQRCASYNGNNYKIVDLSDENEDTWSINGNSGSLEGVGNIGGTYGIGPKSWFIASDTDITHSGLVVPGDIIYMNNHVGIVRSVRFEDNTRNVTTNDVFIIESTGFGWSVINTGTWKRFIDWGEHNIQLKRLMID